MNIFDINLIPQKTKEVDKIVEETLEKLSHKSLFIVTLNPEILLTARKNPSYKKIINSAQIKLIDGFGIVLVAWLKKNKISDRITGVDFSKRILEKTEKIRKKTAIIFYEKGLSPKEKIEEFFGNYRNIQLIPVTEREKATIETKNLKNKKLILVALGHPYQEILIDKLMREFPRNKVFIGIGGTLDFWTNTVKRAPNFLRSLGLEWVWRLLQQPKRISRIINAVIKFPILAIINNKENDRK